MKDSLKKIFIIAQDTFLMALNQKLIYGILMIAVLFILMTNLPFKSEEFIIFKDKPIEISAINFAFFFINLFLLIISIFVSLSLLQNGLTKDRKLLLLTKPIRRSELWLGIIFGLFWIFSLVWLVMVIETLVILFIHTQTINITIFPAMSLILLLSFLYTSIVSFLYTFMPNSLSGIFAALIIFSGFGSSEVLRMTEGMFSAYFTNLMKMSVFLLPRIAHLLGISMNMLGIFSEELGVFSTILHTIGLILLLNLIAVFRFSMKAKSKYA